jgi:E1A-binding protein p400
MRKLARKAATACKTSGKDIASKAIAAQHAEQAALRRIASLCAREVRVFWGKAEKLVRLCAQQEADQRRKADMDKHLQLVVAQTERYAALVANQLTSAPGAAAQGGAQQRTSQPAAGAAPRPAGVDADAAHDDDEFAPDDEMEGEEDDEATLEEEEAAAAAAGEDVATELAALAAEQDAPLEQLLPPEVLARYRQGTASEDDEAEGSDEEGGSDDDGSVHLSDEDPEDDEGTLAEELAEAAARGEDQPEAAAAELAELQAEADLPIEQLLARYGAASGAADAMDVDSAEDDDADASSDAEEDGDDGSDSDDEGQPAWANALLATPAPVAPGASAEEAEAAAEAGRQGLERVAAVAAACAGSSRTPVPFLLRATLRDYQRDGLDWLVALHNRQLNGILADEMVRRRRLDECALCALVVAPSHTVFVPRVWERRFRPSRCWLTSRVRAACGARTWWLCPPASCSTGKPSSSASAPPSSCSSTTAPPKNGN